MNSTQLTLHVYIPRKPKYQRGFQKISACKQSVQ